MITDSTSELAAGALPPAIDSLIESAAAAFETDLSASKSYLLRACAALRARRAAGSRMGARGRRALCGGLAPWQVNKVMAYIESRLASSFCADDLARIANLSPSYFIRAFKSSVGVRPFEYIMQRRVELAQRLMEQTNDPLSDIAIACGLCDQSHLCRVFRRMTGETPRAWRRARASGVLLG